jgi:hypothetical protein
MRSVRLDELRELLHGPEFAAWWSEWQRLAEAVREARVRHEELSSQAELMVLRAELAQRAAVDAFSRAGDVGDEGTRWTAEAQAHENRALALVGEFEDQRARASALWHRAQGAEDDRQRQALAAEYEAEDRRRNQLWAEVEAAWAASFERSLVGAERAVDARRARRDAERLIAEAEERRVRARQLAADAGVAEREVRQAEGRVAALLDGARERFGCVPGRAWLYWRHQDDKGSALAVALSDAPGGDHPEVKALDIRVVGRQRGVEALVTPTPTP